jgi:hypothetical protein
MSTPQEEAVSPEEQAKRDKAADLDSLRERALDLLRQKLQDSAWLCPVCGDPKSRVGDIVNLPIGRGHPSELVYLVVPLFCDNCGHVRFFDATTLGVVPPRDKS